MSAAPEREQPERPGEPALVRKLRARQAEHKQRGRLYRLMFVAVGLGVLCAGIAMLVLPGPAFVVIPIGLAILSLEFAWAERLLEQALIQAEQARRPRRSPPRSSGTSRTCLSERHAVAGLTATSLDLAVIGYDRESA